MQGTKWKGVGHGTGNWRDMHESRNVELLQSVDPKQQEKGKVIKTWKSESVGVVTSQEGNNS